MSLLPDLLRLAAENRRWREGVHGGVGPQRLEDTVDELHRALADQRAGEAERLRAQKLSALAEFAAGAAHEINNPLAVISGQAQYLLKQLSVANGRWAMGDGAVEDDRENRKAKLEHPLQTIIAQTQRVHQILRELMQFARPPRPRAQPVHLPVLIREVATALGELAAQRHVQLRIEVEGNCEVRSPPRDPVPPPTALADAAQVRTALTCLLRNAVEAAPAEGWAAVRLELRPPDQIEVVVEDSGQGPQPHERELLFDPFYSGRQAGRGRGLGLPTAWRLAREQGGDLRFAGLPTGPTRFVLTLPLHLESEPARNGACHPAGVPD
jgi:signal transduction histidine kinase